MVEIEEREAGASLPPGIADRWLMVDEAALLARRRRGHIHVALARGRLAGRQVQRRWHSAWEIRLSDLNDYVQRIGTGTRGGPRPQKPTTLDWDRLSQLPPPDEPA
jgi:hypothetical protein